MTKEERQLLATLKGLGPAVRSCLGTVLSGFKALGEEMAAASCAHRDLGRELDRLPPEASDGS